MIFLFLTVVHIITPWWHVSESLHQKVKSISHVLHLHNTDTGNDTERVLMNLHFYLQNCWKQLKHFCFERTTFEYHAAALQVISISMASSTVYPCRCLCLGWVLQYTNSRPLRQTKKQSLHRLFRAVFVFIPDTGCTHASCWHCPSKGTRIWEHTPTVGVTILLACAVTEVMVVKHRRRPEDAGSWRAAHLAICVSWWETVLTSRGRNRATMVSQPAKGTKNITLKYASAELVIYFRLHYSIYYYKSAPRFLRLIFMAHYAGFYCFRYVCVGNCSVPTFLLMIHDYHQG